MSSSENQNNGYLAVGVFLGFALSTAGYLWVSSCEFETVLWFCNEESPVVDRTLELIESTISATVWPTTALLIAFLFRGHLKDLFPRITKVGPSGFEFSSGKRAQTASPTSLDELAPIPNMIRTKAIADLELELHQVLQQFEPADRDNILVRELAHARLDFVFLDVYRMIYGSQYQLLKRLKSSGGRASRTDVQEFFESVQEAVELHENRILEEFTRFLETRQLVTWDEDQLVLLPIGEDFLAFVFNRSLNEELPN